MLRFTASTIVTSLLLAGVSRASDQPPLRATSMEPVYKIDPEYPPAALRFRIQGTVRFEALIAEDGHIARLRLVSGHPLLVRAAREAAQKWIFRPTLRRGKPVRVITEFDVEFQLDSHGNPVKKDNAKPDARGLRC